MHSLTTIRFDGNGSMREHILTMIDLASKLKNLEVPITDTFLVHLALESLPAEFTNMRDNYITQREKWSLNKLIAICVHQEARIKREKSVNVVNFGD